MELCANKVLWFTLTEKDQLCCNYHSQFMAQLSWSKEQWLLKGIWQNKSWLSDWLMIAVCRNRQLLPCHLSVISFCSTGTRSQPGTATFAHRLPSYTDVYDSVYKELSWLEIRWNVALRVPVPININRPDINIRFWKRDKHRASLHSIELHMKSDRCRNDRFPRIYIVT